MTTKDQVNPTANFSLESVLSTVAANIELSNLRGTALVAAMTVGRFYVAYLKKDTDKVQTVAEYDDLLKSMAQDGTKSRSAVMWALRCTKLVSNHYISKGGKSASPLGRMIQSSEPVMVDGKVTKDASLVAAEGFTGMLHADGFTTYGKIIAALEKPKADKPDTATVRPTSASKEAIAARFVADTETARTVIAEYLTTCNSRVFFATLAGIIKTQDGILEAREVAAKEEQAKIAA